jgi:hypothetical protein
MSAPGQRAGRARIADRVEAQLDQIGVRDGVALLTQLGRRSASDGHTEQRFRHSSQSAIRNPQSEIKKASSTRG